MSVPAGIFLGGSRDQYGERAWLVCLDSSARQGTLYLPPDILRLSFQNPKGSLVLESQKAFGDLVYVFELKPTEQLLVGAVSTLRLSGNLRKPLRKSDVSLQALHDGHSLLEEPFGVYSNLKYLEQAGDLLGSEVILFRRKDSAVGLITRFEGAPDGPYLLSDTILTGSSVRFSIISIHGRESYSGLLSSNRLKLTNTTNPSLKTEILKRGTFDQVFHSTCEVTKRGD
jgi:hypothetical protein